MNKEQINELVREISKTSHGEALRIYLTEKVKEIKDIEKITSYEELIGRKIASKYLNEIIRFIYSKDVPKKGTNEYV